MLKLMTDDRVGETYVEISAADKDQAIDEALRAFGVLVQEMARTVGREAAERFLLAVHNMDHAGVYGLLMMWREEIDAEEIDSE